MLFSIKQFKKEKSSLKQLKSSTQLHPLVKEQIKQKVLASIKQTEKVPVSYVKQLKRKKFLQAVTSVLVSLGLLGGTAFASSSADPGQILYPVKLAVEKVEVALTVSEESKAKVEAKHVATRIEELNKVSVKAASGEVKEDFKAAVEVETEKQVSAAIDNLTEFKERLSAKQNFQAAARVDESIVRLEAKAGVQLKFKKKQNQEATRIRKVRDGEGDNNRTGSSDVSEETDTSRNLETPEQEQSNTQQDQQRTFFENLRNRIQFNR